MTQLEDFKTMYIYNTLVIFFLEKCSIKGLALLKDSGDVGRKTHDPGQRVGHNSQHNGSRQ
jgi:hypothetical protein